MSKNEHEENLMKEFANSEGQGLAENVYGTNQGKEPVTDLGKVRVQTPGKIDKEELDSDPNIRRMQSLIEHVPINMAELPTRGRFYSEDARIWIRAARVGEVREYSMMDESNPADVIEKMNYILSSCSKVMFGNVQGSYKDIMDHDRFYVLLKISELTFVNGETNIQIPIPAGSCKTPGCKHQKSTKLTTGMLERAEPDEILEKYYDDGNRCYSIRTKSYGTIQIAPPTIGVTSAIRDWAVGRAQNAKEWDESIIQMIPFFRREWRGLTDREIHSIATEFEGWDIGKFTLVYRFIERLNTSVGMSPNIHITCESCGGDMVVPVMFQSESDTDRELRGGFKALFVQNISDRLDELL